MTTKALLEESVADVSRQDSVIAASCLPLIPGAAVDESLVIDAHAHFGVEIAPHDEVGNAGLCLLDVFIKPDPSYDIYIGSLKRNIFSS